MAGVVVREIVPRVESKTDDLMIEFPQNGRGKLEDSPDCRLTWVWAKYGVEVGFCGTVVDRTRASPVA